MSDPLIAPIAREGTQIFGSIQRDRSGQDSGVIGYGARGHYVGQLGDRDQKDLVVASLLMTRSLVRECKSEVRRLSLNHFEELGKLFERECETYYVCTSYMKTHALDDHETGCELQQHYKGGGQCDIRAKTLPQLFEALADFLDIRGEKIDDVWLAGEGSQRICWNRLETARGQKPSAATIEKWKAREVKLYLADYDFIIERRQTSAVCESDLDSYRIKHHE